MSVSLLLHYYTQLQEARKEDGESPAKFLDRIKAITAKKKEN
jgi:hypothetical protein